MEKLDEKMRKNYTDILNYIDSQWVSENPDIACDLIIQLIKQINHYKDSIESLKMKNLCSAILLSENKNI